MKAIIFAAGKGMRLRPMTDSTPKPMIAVAGKPILERTLEALPDAVREVVFVVGYLKEQIINRFGITHAGRRIIYADQGELRGTLHALRAARPHLDDTPFLVLNGDDLYHKADLERIVRHPNSILVSEWENPERFGVCVVDEYGNLKDLKEKPAHLSGTFLVYTGASVLTQSIFSEPVVYGKNDEELLPPAILSLGKKTPVVTLRAQFWHPIGFPEDIASAELKLAERARGPGGP